MPGPTATRLAALALAASLVACDAQAHPSPPPDDAAAWKGADLVALVTRDEVNAVVGINVATQTVTAPGALEKNTAQPHMDGGMLSIPPLSVVLSDSNRSTSLLWTVASGLNAVQVRELDRATGQVRAIDAPALGVLPFLYDGRLAWASAPRVGPPRLLAGDGSFEISLPSAPLFVVAGPGKGRISVVVDRGNRQERILVVDVESGKTTELPTERLHFGGIWADDTTLAASVYSRIVPTAEDPENGEPDNRVLTWSIDDGSSAEAVAGLVAGDPLRTNLYPELVAGGEGLVAVVTGSFDVPQVEVHLLAAADPARVFKLAEAAFVTAMSISGKTLVVLQTRHVTFIDLPSGAQTTVGLEGVTQTMWVGP